MSLRFLDELLGPLIVPPRRKRKKAKTITVAIKDGKTNHIVKERWGWPNPPRFGGWINGTGGSIYKECVQRWKDEGYEVKRVPNPYYN